MIPLRFAAIVCAQSPAFEPNLVIPTELPLEPRLFASCERSNQADGWSNLVSDGGSTLDLARLGMQRLPLVDGFLLVVEDGRVARRLDAELFFRMSEIYSQARLKLGRIVALREDEEWCWPWLIDIGFRQPLVELAEGADFAQVIENNLSQVQVIDL